MHTIAFSLVGLEACSIVCVCGVLCVWVRRLLLPHPPGLLEHRQAFAFGSLAISWLPESLPRSVRPVRFAEVRPRFRGQLLTSVSMGLACTALRVWNAVCLALPFQ